ncbi:MAG: hypothetical protein JWL84_4917 [Rhodospirillales bacterium]|nr:hypothetical protein [Rhodospirillales bacterium]
MTEGGPAALRLKAADFIRLASDARNRGISRELYQIAQRYLVLAQSIEDRGAPSPVPVLGADEADSVLPATSDGSDRLI